MIRVKSDMICVVVDNGDDDEPTVYGPFPGWNDANDYCRRLNLGLSHAKILRNQKLWPDGFDPSPSSEDVYP